MLSLNEILGSPLFAEYSDAARAQSHPETRYGAETTKIQPKAKGQYKTFSSLWFQNSLVIWEPQSTQIILLFPMSLGGREILEELRSWASSAGSNLQTEQ